jgi:hypothetical protein
MEAMATQRDREKSHWDCKSRWARHIVARATKAARQSLPTVSEGRYSARTMPRVRAKATRNMGAR